jgi:octaprenyl-diphosphate synthase
MVTIEDIKSPISQHLNAFEKTFRASMKSSVPLLDIITRYILKRKGKQMRPMFVLFSAELCGGINKSSFIAASLIELLHTATLIHDDVVDDSNTRRGLFSINALWKNKIAVLVGDYLLSRGLLIALENDEFQLLKIVSNATREMSEGELLQIEKARKLDITEEIYFEIIRKKTASLIAACCSAGATSASSDAEIIKKMHDFGECTGMAFQLKDDLFDYETNPYVGKPNGLDIREKKMTLPLIHMLGEKNFFEKRQIIHHVKHHNDDPEKIRRIVDQVNYSGGIDYVYKKMLEYRDKAFKILHGFPESETRHSLEKLVTFTIDRKN